MLLQQTANASVGGPLGGPVGPLGPLVSPKSARVSTGAPLRLACSQKGREGLEGSMQAPLVLLLLLLRLLLLLLLLLRLLLMLLRL